MIYLVICAASLLIATLTLFSGFGLGTLLLPTFSFFFPIELAVAATAIVHLANNIFKFFLVGRMADFKVTMKFSIPAAVCAALGAWLLLKIGSLPSILTYRLLGSEFHVEPIKLTIGMLIAVFSLFEFVPALENVAVSRKYISLGGAISGFFGGLSGLQGALRSIFLIRVGLSKDQYIGTTVASAIIVDISRIIVYGIAMFGRYLSDLKDRGIVHLVAAACLAAFIGSTLGAMLLKKTTLGTVKKTVGALLLIVALGLMGGLI